MNVSNLQLFPSRLFKAAALASIVNVSNLFGADETIAAFTDWLESQSEISVFANALEQSGLISELGEAGSMTIFIPTNKALESDGSRFLLEDVLLAPENNQRLIDTISYHIVLGEMDINAKTVATLGDNCLDINVADGTADVGIADKVTQTLEYGSVTIHIVSSLLIQDWDDERVCKVGG